MSEKKNYSALDKKKFWIIRYSWIWIILIGGSLVLLMHNIDIEESKRLKIKVDKSVFWNVKSEIQLFPNENNEIVFVDEIGDEYYVVIQEEKYLSNEETYLYVFKNKDNKKIKGEFLIYKKSDNLLNLIIEYYIK